MLTNIFDQAKKFLSFIQNIMKRRMPRWVTIMLWILIIVIWGIPILCLLSAGLFYGYLVMLGNLSPSSMPVMVVFVTIILLLYIILLTVWCLFSKNKSLTKFLLDATPFLFSGAILYFWFKAYGWESRISESWDYNPELSNLSAILEYTKALVKTIMLSSITVIAWLYLKRGQK